MALFMLSTDTPRCEVRKYTAASLARGTKLTLELVYHDPFELSYAMQALAELQAAARTPQKPAAKARKTKRLQLPHPEDFE